MVKPNRIIIVSRGDEARWHTLKLLHGIVDAEVVVHRRAIANKVEAAFPKFTVHVSGTDSLVDKRNWILKKLVKRDEWFIGMDDNIQGFTAVHPSYREQDYLDVTGDPPHGYESWRRVYNQPVSVKVWLKIFLSAVQNSRYPLVGVSTTENPYFRRKRLSNYRFVKTKVFAMQNTGLLMKHNLCHDSYLSAATVAHYGGVEVHNYLHYKSKMYEAGGLGNREEREAAGLLKQLDSVCAEFPDLVVRATGKNSALRFRVVTPDGVSKWRREHGY